LVVVAPLSVPIKIISLINLPLAFHVPVRFPEPINSISP